VVKSSTFYMRRTQDQKGFDNLGSGSWLAWANDTTEHFVAIARISEQLDPLQFSSKTS